MKNFDPKNFKLFSLKEIVNLDDKNLFKYSQFVGKNARGWKKRFTALLPEISKRELHRKHGFATITEFAALVGGVGRKTVETIFQVEKHLHDKPILKETIATEGIYKVRAVATIATQENQAFLAKKVKTMSKAGLERFASEAKIQMAKTGEKIRFTPPGGNFKEEGNSEEVGQFENMEPRITMSFKIEPEIELKLRQIKQQIEKEQKQNIEWNEVMRILVSDKKLNKKNRSACAHPNCNKPAAENHHQERYSLVKNHEKRVPLCKAHHELAHHGCIKNEDKSPEKWEFQQRHSPEEWRKKAVDRKFVLKKMGREMGRETDQQIDRETNSPPDTT